MSSGYQCRSYYNPNPFLSVSWHDTTIPLPAPPFMGPAKVPHIDFSVVQGLWLGCFLSTGRDKYVVSEDLLFVGRMSDAGFIVPHISIPPSWWNILTTLFGMSNSLFGSSAVTIACANLLWGDQDCDLAVTPFGPVPFSLNVACWDPISLPTDIVVVWGTVYAGFTLSDLASAGLDYAMTVVTDVISAGAAKGLSKSAKKIGKSGGWKKVTGKVNKKLFGSTAKRGAKKAAKVTSKLGTYDKYVAKAAQLDGIAKSLKMTDKQLAEYASDRGLKNAAGNVSDLAKQVDELKKNPLYKQLVKKNTTKGMRQASGTLGNRAISSSAVKKMMAIKNVLSPALRELDDAVAKVAAKKVAEMLGWKIAGKSVTKLLRCGLRYGNWIGDGSTGGIFSTGGFGITNYFQRTLQMEDKWYAGLTGVDDAEDYWDDAYVVTGDDDYWYDLNDADQDDDEDYWYDEETEVST